MWLLSAITLSHFDSRTTQVLATLLKYGLQLGSCVRSKKDGTILPACAQAAMAEDPHYIATAMKFVKLETEHQYYTNKNAWNAMAFEIAVGETVILMTPPVYPY